ncbi:alpha/beta hydrolase family protein [Holdemania massiliensis]|uniref:Prolyl oligopeptidase family serine peptidase n=1 Tax=Holdemania massiliensis TaxID=1468449 RepID=A0A6N7S992_9FIRM|nr:prolyl oligopeptidase family serine peptidase [Holdemania massiliensis]MSA72198.1 prolyl oligopeptidase family serine peptidase [Holdemania massiliensis]MSA90474.1 prolyl oligopeptidase family serine peptidase [Holdemania massiliensis]MSB79280.1 prolyl oligopeptidase family serine peptidase [Holdemania massiliensis]MSC34204.1 prolyl oligopeptidase family serine peptidase [Holdemania massiliensis]MSC40594.1 prolyl oligopeptidase family serine peptidase [Holdemania massiliensis]
MWLIAQRANALQALVTVDLKTKKLKTEKDWNQAALLDRYVAQPQYFPFSSRGRRIDGWVMPPINYDSSQQYPAVLQIHGGPNLAYGEVFHHEMQMLASAGYFVLFCNPVGSVGRTDEFADIRGRCGDEDYQNLMDFISAVLPAFPAIDSKRVAVCGGSYGGFMVNWIIGHTSQFVCAVSQRSIANFMTIYGLSDFGYYFVRDQLAAEPLSEAGQAAIHQQSPIRYVGNVQTPTLFLHSDQDWRCPLSEGLQMFTALTDLGVKTRMVCFFQGENHELSRSGKPQARQRRLFEIQSWLDQWCHKQ